MNRNLLLVMGVGLFFFSCKKEQDHNHNTTDTSFPEVTLTAPADSSIYHNGDTVFITGTVTDNELHSGTIIIKNDTTMMEYFNQVHYVHDLTSAPISYQYIVSGITQNEAVTLAATYEDHTPNTRVVTRKLFFQP